MTQFLTFCAIILLFLGIHHHIFLIGFVYLFPQSVSIIIFLTHVYYHPPGSVSTHDSQSHDLQLPSSLARAIRFEHRTHSPEVKLVL